MPWMIFYSRLGPNHYTWKQIENAELLHPPLAEGEVNCS